MTPSTTTTTPLEVLRRMDALLDSPEKWTRFTYAADSDSCLVPPSSPAAVCWCLRGLVRRFTIDYKHTEFLILKALEPQIGWTRNGSEIARWQDAPERTFPEIKAALARAIKLAEEQAHEA